MSRRLLGQFFSLSFEMRRPQDVYNPKEEKQKCAFAQRLSRKGKISAPNVV